MGILSTELLCYSFGDSKGGSVDKVRLSFPQSRVPLGKRLATMARSRWPMLLVPGASSPTLTRSRGRLLSLIDGQREENQRIGQLGQVSAS